MTRAIPDGSPIGGTLASANGGTLALIGTLAIAAGVTDTVTFQNVQLGDDPVILNGPGTLDSTGTVYVANSGNAELELTGGAVWNTAGTVYDQGAVQFGTIAGDSGTINNLAGAAFDLYGGNARLAEPATGATLFNNAGTLEQTAGGNDYIYVALNNSGLVQTTNGFLEIHDATLGGTFAASSSGTLALVGLYAVGAGDADTVDFQSATLGWTSDGAAILAGPGTLDSNGVVTVRDWYNTAVQLELTGGITWNNAGTVYNGDVAQFGTAAGDSATINNLAGAVFDLSTGDGWLTTDGAGTYVFNNAAIAEQTNGGNDYVYVTVDNTGLVETTSGSSNHNATPGGTFAASSNGTLALAGVYAVGAVTSTRWTSNPRSSAGPATAPPS